MAESPAGERRSTRVRRREEPAARFLRDSGDAFAYGPPRAPTMVALVALRTHSLFLDGAQPQTDAAKRARAEEIMQLNRTFSDGT